MAVCHVFDEIKRVLTLDGTCWVNLGDTYSREKSLCQIPSRFTIEMIDRGWILRNEIIWHKPNCMPSSATDRFTTDFEKLFLFVKSPKYWFQQQLEPALMNRWGGNKFVPKQHYNYKNQAAVKVRARDMMPEQRNKRCVWSVPTRPLKEAHFASYPEKLIEIPIKAGCPVGGIVLDPFFGSGTTGVAAKKLGRGYLGIELNPEYIEIANLRLGLQSFSSSH